MARRGPSGGVSEVAERIGRECLAFRARRLDRVVTRIFDEQLRPLGMKITQLNLLVGIGQFPGVRPGALGTAFGLEKSSLSRNVQRLVDAGWVTATAEAGGAVRLALTHAGEKQLADAFPAWQKAQARTREVLGADAQRVLESMGRRLLR